MVPPVERRYPLAPLVALARYPSAHALLKTHQLTDRRYREYRDRGIPERVGELSPRACTRTRCGPRCAPTLRLPPPRTPSGAVEKARQRAYYIETRDYWLRKARGYAAADPGAAAARAREWRRRNPDRALAWRQSYYEANRETLLAKRKDRYRAARARAANAEDMQQEGAA